MSSRTTYSLNDPEVNKVWSKSLFHGVMRRTVLFNPEYGFCKKDANSLVQERTELKKGAGDRIRFTLINQLSGAGVQGSNTLEGKEEGLDTDTWDLTIDQLRHAVKTEGKMTDQRVHWDTLAEARDKLSDWFSTRMDVAGFAHLCGWTAAGVSHYLDAGGAQIDGTDTRYTGNVAVTAIDANHILRVGASNTTDQAVGADTAAIFDVDQVDYTIAKLKTMRHPIRPVRYKGKSYYLCFLHPNQVRHLRDSSTDWYSIMQAALQGGRVDDNPLFSGALGMYNDTLFFESSYVSPGINSSTGAGVANTRRAVFAGAQALAIGYGKGYGKSKMSWKHADWDYGDKYAAAGGSIFGIDVPRFDVSGTDERLASIVVTSYAKDLN